MPSSKSDSGDPTPVQHLANESMQSSATLSASAWASAVKRFEGPKSSGNSAPTDGGKPRHKESMFAVKQATAPETMDPIMRRLELRYEPLPAERQYSVQSSSRKQRGEQRSDVVDVSMQAVQGETVALLTRHLPCIPSTLPDVTEWKEATKSQNEPVLDDRITAQTIHRLLCKGHFRDRKRQLLKCRSKQAIEEFDELLPSNTVNALSKQVSRLEPPFVEKMMEAKMYCKQQKNDESTPREVHPASCEGTPFSRAPPGYYHSHLSAPPPSRCSFTASPKGDLSPLQKQALPGILTASEDNFPAKIPASVTLTLSTAAGDDQSIVDQVVAYAASKRRPSVAVVGGDLIETNTQGDPYGHGCDLKLHPSHKPVFSALDAVLSVSKEYEKVQQQWPGRSASRISAARRGITERITSLHSSRIPPEFWVSIHQPTLPGTRLLQHPHLAKREQSGSVPEKTLMFPAANATGRAQVYLLADTLDRMLEEGSGDLEVLADKELALLLIPEELDDGKPAGLGAVGSSEKFTNVCPLKSSDDAHAQYIQSAERVMKTIDIGLAELSRQVGSFCIERGALLDSLRIVINDLSSSCFALVSYCKDRARQELMMRRELASASSKDVEMVFELREQLKKAQSEAQALREVNNEYVKKAQKYDTLIERLMLKDSMFYKHSADLHLSMLMELEESYTESTNKGMDALYHHTSTNAAEPKVAEAPIIRLATMKQKEHQEAEKKVYEESYRLISVLSKTMDTVEKVCQPLYDHVDLPKHRSTVNVASSKWAMIASAVGSYEVEKKHRRRVFDVFAEWNSLQEPVPASALPDDKLKDDEVENKSHAVESHAYSYSTTPRGLENTHNADAQEGTFTTDVVTASQCTELGQPSSAATRRMRPITKEDLVAMDVKDCTAEEINALYAEDFDMAAYLHPEWNPPTDVELTPMVLRDMIHDVTESLMHIALRMQALSTSSFIEQCLKPPAMPPAHPEEPCSLCGRKDRSAIGKKNRGEALQKVANEVQRRYEMLGQKCQRAEAERERLRKELQMQQAHECRLAREFGMREEELKKANAELAEENNRRGRRRRSQINTHERPRSSFMRSSVLSEMLNLSGSIDDAPVPGEEEK